MKTFVAFVLIVTAQFPLAVLASSSSEKSTDAEALSAISRGHEQVAKELAGDHTAVVVQKGDKQFTIYGVVSVRAVGPVVEITVKNGEKYSVSAADIFFITNNGFKI